jgi:hypothetical protein
MMSRVTMPVVASAPAGGWPAVLVCCAMAAGCSPQSKTPVGASVASGSASPHAAGAPLGAAMVGASQAVTWACTGNPCPWGGQLSNQALVWPADTGAVSARLGYTVSGGIYLPAPRANGVDLAIETGEAGVHAGPLGAADHRLLATLRPGQTLHVTGLGSGEVLSVQADAPFTYRIVLPPPGQAPTTAEPPPAAGSPHGVAGQPPQRHPPGTPRGRVVRSTTGLWKCNHTPGCFSDPWPGTVITWPAWSAHQSNGRAGNVQRFVFSTSGEPLYPYMGSWAQGCEVTAESGRAKVVEWQRGLETWRETVLSPGEFHVIELVPPEDGALIEGIAGESAFSVSLRNCTPQRIAP